TTPLVFLADWRTSVAFAPEGPQPRFLVDGADLKLILAGLEQGHQLPPHPEAQAVYHFLEGAGTMTVNGESFAVKPGSTVVAPAGATRGLVAESRLAFLAVKSA
ncbi:MAG TPA: cupin domain-containing protein, partial [Caldilineaceae bacterium]|nr:cupin domain-containing protein [Caldilineaceae bacterium]